MCDVWYWCKYGYILAEEEQIYKRILSEFKIVTSEIREVAAGIYSYINNRILGLIHDWALAHC